MNWLRSCQMAFALYSKIPMPPVDWNPQTQRHVLDWFPLVGLPVGLLWAGWLWLGHWLSIGPVLWGIGMTAIPLMVTGGIHMDGFCDVCDARGSYQSRERKLDIMKDPHLGAFGVMGCVGYLGMEAGLWSELARQGFDRGWILILLPVYLRATVGCLARTLPQARAGGMLAQCVGTGQRAWCLGLVGSLTLVGMGLACWKSTLGLFPLSLALLWYGVSVMRREFGGITGDLAGWCLQMEELACVAGMTLIGYGGGWQ